MSTSNTPRRFLPLVAALLLAAVASASCFWQGPEEGVDSPRAQRMAALITAAVDRYNSQGPGAFWDLLVEEIKRECSRESFQQAVAGQPAPVTYKRLVDVDFDGRRARAKIDMVTSQGDRVIEWRLYELDNGSWRIEFIPGMEDCSP